MSPASTAPGVGPALTLPDRHSYNPASTTPCSSTRGKTPIRPRSVLTKIQVSVVAIVALACVGAGARPAASAPAAPVAAASATATPASRAGTMRAVAQDLRGATFEYVPGVTAFDTVSVGGAPYARISVFGAVVVEPPGRPALPTATLHVGIPDGMSPRLRVTAEEWGERAGPPPPVPVARQRFISDDPKTGPVSEFTFDPDPGVYARAALYPAQGAELGRGAAVGEMWVAPVHIHPIRWDPRSRAYRILRRMTLRVDFVPATDAERAQRPTFRPGGDVGPWRRVQEGLVKNYESARSFPIRPKSMPRPAGRARVAVNPEFKLSVKATGWTSVSFGTLSGAGFPAGIAINTVTVSERGYDDVGDSAVVTTIPVVARDNNSNGTFDAGDAITFYARSLRDRVGSGSLENRYTDVNVYWLTWDAGPAAVPDTITGVIPDPAPQAPNSFRDTIHLEQNPYLLAWPNSSVASPPEAVDHFFWTRGDELDALDQFEQPIPFLDPDGSQPFRIRAHYQGRNNSVHRLSIFYLSSTGITDTLTSNEIFLNQDVFTLDTGFSIPGSLIGGGQNRYRHVGTRETSTPGTFIPGSRAFLDWIEATYSRLYTARGNTLLFTSGTSGAVAEIRVGGFTSSNIEVYDVTIPTAAERVFGVAVNPTGPTFEAVFRTSATDGERRFVALVPGVEITVGSGAVAQDAPSTLTVPGTFSPSSLARSILITPQAFRAPTDRLADYRRAQGYVVEVADVQDVYDEFNGGIKSAGAIRRYLRHAYLAWTPRPTFVVLAGDASLDYRHLLAGSGVDWVPTYLQFEEIPGPNGKELVAHDSHYSLNLAATVPGDSDFIPSLFLARVPAGSASELDQFVTKAIQYESFQPTDTWRGRMLLVSDDEFSTGLFSTTSYCQSFQEAFFKQTNVDFAGVAAASQSGQDIQSIFYDLKAFTDPVPTFPDGSGNTCRNGNDVRTALGTTGGGYDVFAAQATQGGLLVNVQVHANRYQMAHEVIYCGSPPAVSFCNQDVGPDRIQNVGRSALLMVWGCHANQFPDGPFSTSIDSTDAIGEQWLLFNNRGSIGSLGSSAFEFLNTNSVYNLFVADAFFTTPPTDAPPPGEPRRARWIMGEVLGAAAVRNGMVPFSSQAVMNRTVNLLGDPMTKMDALPPRVFEVTVNGAAIADGGSFTTDSPTDSLTLVAKVRDESGVQKTSLAERDLASGAITPIDSTLYATTLADTGRLMTLTARARPRNENYDLQVRAIDGNGRLQIFTLQARVPIRFLANGIDIVNGVFVENAAVLRAEVTTPIPVTADSLQLFLDGVPIVVAKTQTDAAGRQWVLEGLPEGRGPGSHTLQVAIGGRTAGLDQVAFQVSAQFTMRGVAVVSQRIQGSGCGGQVFQYELSAPASRVELLLMTVSGRRVSSKQMPGSAGFNVYCWDGRDSQGHEAAAGVYFYRIRATDPSGRIVSQDGRMIRAR